MLLAVYISSSTPFSYRIFPHLVAKCPHSAHSLLRASRIQLYECVSPLPTLCSIENVPTQLHQEFSDFLIQRNGKKCFNPVIMMLISMLTYAFSLLQVSDSAIKKLASLILQFLICINQTFQWLSHFTHKKMHPCLSHLHTGQPMTDRES